MGIKNINNLLKRHPEITINLPVADLDQTHIAVDTPIYLSKYLYVHLSDHFKTFSDEDIMQFESFHHSEITDLARSVVNRMLDSFSIYSTVTGARFTMILEGSDVPPEKIENAGRRRARDGARQRERCREFVEMNQIDSVRKILPSIKNIELKTLTDHLRIELDKTNRFDYLDAPGESERYACELRHQGMVDHILTTDTDCLAMGQSIIKDIDVLSMRYTMIDYSKILESLELTPEQFTDLCIMCGCDYNDNMRGIGVIKSYSLIKKHSDIESIGSVRDISILDHERCRELFKL